MNTGRRIIHWALPVILTCLSVAPAWSQNATGVEKRQERIDRAVKSAVEYVLSQIDPKTGRCLTEYKADTPRYGAKTMLCVYSLLSAEVSYRKQPRLRRAIQWALDAKFDGTAPVALRTVALAALKDPRAQRHLSKDVKWLARAGYSNGAYTYGSVNGKAWQAGDPYDNANSYLAALGMAAAEARGVPVPLEFWQRAEKYWLSQQLSSGGWGFCLRKRKGRPFTNPYGSMTAAGIGALSMCSDQLGRTQTLRKKTRNQNEAAINLGLHWLEENFSVRRNPNKGPEWYYDWLFNLQRLGMLTGRRFIAGTNWYDAGRAELLHRQNDDGSWGYGDRIEATAYALLFLAKGGAPIFVNKVRYPGKWNSRPNDAKNIATWLTYTYERQIGWQVLDIDADAANWADGRVCYLSGAGPMVLTKKQIAQLRRFVDRGGMILSEPARNNGDFTIDVLKTYQKIFPKYRMVKIPADSPLYTLQFKGDKVEPRGLLGISNGVRLLAVHAPRQFSLAFEQNAFKKRRAVFNLLANTYLYLSNMGYSKTLRLPPVPKPTKPAQPIAKIKLARVKYKGIYDPEPLAMPRLASELAAKWNIDLAVSEPIEIEKLDASTWPVAWITGGDAIKLDPGQIAVLRRYVESGGTIIADAAGGNAAFAKSFGEDIMPALGKVVQLDDESAVLKAGPYVIDEVAYRPGAALDMRFRKKAAPEIQAVFHGKRAAVIFSAEDITAALVGYPVWGIRGYKTPDALRLSTNFLCYAAGVKIQPPAK